MIDIYIVFKMQDPQLKQKVLINHIFYQFVVDSKINMSKT